MAVVSTIAGALLILIGLNDVFHTLLRPAATGRLTMLIFRGAWALGARRSPHVISGGPLTVIATIFMWLVLLVVGWALIYLPHVPGGFSYSGVDPSDYHPFAEAVTYSLVALTTLGLGDVVPAEPWLRLVSPLEALMGFALLSASVSWFMQLFPALARRRALAIELTSLSEAGMSGLPADIGAARAASVVSSVRGSVAQVTADLVQNAEILYFTEEDPRLSSTRAIRFAMELRDAALGHADADVRAEGRALARTLDELARVLRGFPHVSGEETDDVLREVAGTHGYDRRAGTP